MGSLRRQNRLRTKRAVQAAALDSFEARGYDAVTVEEVAEAAGTSPSTVYRHFGTKEALVLWDETDERLEGALVRHLGTAAPFDALRRAFVEVYAALSDDELALQRRRGALIDATPILSATLVGDLDRDRGELLDALVAVHPDVDPLELGLAARIALSAVLAGFENWQRAGSDADLAGSVDAAFVAATRAVSE